LQITNTAKNNHYYLSTSIKNGAIQKNRFIFVEP
jgi:hypothetical protein